MNYTLNQLRIFVKIVDLQSVTKASEELYLTQPAVSIQLKKFQDQFSVPLTEVIGRQLYVTDFGQEIAQKARNILEEVEQINYHTERFQNRLAGRLKISVASTGKYVMPYYLTEFLRANPAIELVMDVTNKTQVVESLAKNEVDFALVSVIPDLNMNSINLIANKLYLIASPRLNIGAKKITKKIFETIPLIYREPGSATRSAMEIIITGQNVSRPQKIELTSNEAVKQAVMAGLGISIMPIIGIKNEIENKELEIIPFKNLPYTTEWNIVWAKEKKLSPVASAFLDYIENNSPNISEKYFSWTNMID